MSKYVFEYEEHKVSMGMGERTVYRDYKWFDNLTSLRKWAYGSVSRYEKIRLGHYEGYIRDMKTNQIVGAIDGSKYIYKQNGKLYCRYINNNGTLDSYYGKSRYSGKWRF